MYKKLNNLYITILLFTIHSQITNIIPDRFSFSKLCIYLYINNP